MKDLLDRHLKMNHRDELSDINDLKIDEDEDDPSTLVYTLDLSQDSAQDLQQYLINESGSLIISSSSPLKTTQ